LNVVPIVIPPLRERKGDIVLLADHFLTKYGKGNQYRLSKEIVDSLESYDWPGNVRELENACQRLALLSNGDELRADLLPASMTLPAIHAAGRDSDLIFKIPAEGISLDELERQVIVAALKRNEFNQSKTARFLQIPRHILLYRIEKYKIPMKKNEKNTTARMSGVRGKPADGMDS